MADRLSLVDLQRRRDTPLRSAMTSPAVTRIARGAAAEGWKPEGNRFQRRVAARLMRRAK